MFVANFNIAYSFEREKTVDDGEEGKTMVESELAMN